MSPSELRMFHSDRCRRRDARSRRGRLPPCDLNNPTGLRRPVATCAEVTVRCQKKGPREHGPRGPRRLFPPSLFSLKEPCHWHHSDAGHGQSVPPLLRSCRHNCSSLLASAVVSTQPMRSVSVESAVPGHVSLSGQNPHHVISWLPITLPHVPMLQVFPSTTVPPRFIVQSSREVAALH